MTHTNKNNIINNKRRRGCQQRKVSREDRGAERFPESAQEGRRRARAGWCCHTQLTLACFHAVLKVLYTANPTIECLMPISHAVLRPRPVLQECYLVTIVAPKSLRHGSWRCRCLRCLLHLRLSSTLALSAYPFPSPIPVVSLSVCTSFRVVFVSVAPCNVM